MEEGGGDPRMDGVYSTGGVMRLPEEQGGIQGKEGPKAPAVDTSVGTWGEIAGD